MSTTKLAGQRGVSLRVKLPLLITALLLGVLVAIVWFSYREVRNSAVLAARERLESIASRLSTLAATQVPRRLEAVGAVAAMPSVAEYLASGGRTAAAEVHAALAELMRSSSASTVHVWSADRTPVLELPASAHEADGGRAAWRRHAASAPGAGGVSELFVADGRTVYWAIAPVLHADRLLGYVATLIRTTSRSSELAQIFGSDLAFRLSSANAGEWLTPDAEIVDAPDGWPFTGAAGYVDREGEKQLAFAGAVNGTPWSLIVAMRESAVVARARAFLKWLSLIAVLLVLGGALAASVVVRGVTRPLSKLTVASEEIAAGNYGERVVLERGDELGVLAETFNHMASHIQAAHEELARQFKEARALANELVRANAQLTDAMKVAEQARAEAQTASRAKSDFLATMSHEIRTPINAMIGYADLLEAGISGPLTERQREQLARIRVSGKHLIGLVDEVLDLAGIESGKLRVDPGVERLDDAVETSLAVVRPHAEQKKVNVRLQCRCSPAGTLYFGDRRRVEQILINLASNAVKFTPAGGTVTVHCGTGIGQGVVQAGHGGTPAGVGGDWLDVVVADTGPGIPSEQQERIFEPFVQAETGYTRMHGGIGLGLAISRRLARLMDGDLNVDSSWGGGARFVLRLPAAHEPATGLTRVSAVRAT